MRRRAAAFEPLEGRLLLSAAPVIVYNFDEGAGLVVHDTAPDGSANDGNLIDDGGFLPEFRSGDSPDGSGSYLHFGYEFNEWDYSSGGRVETSSPLHPILGGSGTLAFYIRTQQFGSGAAWQSPGVTGAEHLADGNDIFWGNLDNGGRIRVVAGDGPEAASPQQVAYSGWRHVVQTRDASTGDVRTYLDGYLVASAVSSPGVKGAEFNTIGATTVHPFNSLSEVSQYLYFNGDLDQVEIYDYSMDPRDVAARYGPHAGVPQAPQVTGDNDIIATARLRWPDATDATGYIIERRTSDSAPWQQVGLAPFSSTPEPFQTFTDPDLEVGRTYSYRVTAFNGSGQATSSVVQVVPKASGYGVLSHYWNSGFWGNDERPGDWAGGWYLNTLPDQTIASGHTVKYYWADGAPTPPFAGGGAAGDLRTDIFSTAFTGKIHADDTGDYYFTTLSDDDGLLYVNGQLVSSDPFAHGWEYSRQTAPVYLEGGNDYEFLFIQAEQMGAAGAEMQWVSPAMQMEGRWFEPVPVDHLIAADDAPAAPSGLDVQNDGQTLTFNFTDNATSEWGYVLERRSGGGAFEPVRKGALGFLDPFFTGTVVTPTFTDVPLKAGTYEYRVRAYNAVGSAASNTVSVTVNASFEPQAGVQAFYVDDPAWGVGERPAPGTLPTVGPRVDFTQTYNPINFDYGFGEPVGGVGPDFFSTVFTGTLRSAEAGTYQIYLESDDDGYLLVNGQVVSADPGQHLARDPRSVNDGVQRVFPITLEANTDYNLVALHADRFNNASVVMKWVRPGQTEPEIVPETQFVSNVPGAAGGAADGSPVAPTGLHPVDADSGATFTTLQWNDVATNETRYVLERSTTPGFENPAVFLLPINATSYTDFDLTAATRYYYRVHAANYYGDASASTDVTTLARERVPAAPSDLHGAARADGVHLVFRDGSNTEDQFVVERADAGSATFVPVGTVAGNRRGLSGGNVFFTDFSAEQGHDYVYRVYASSSGGASGPSNTFSVRAGSAGGTGAEGTFYNGQFFTGSTVAVTDFPADRYFSGAAPVAGIDADTYSAVFHAELQPEFTEPYTFYTASDDGIELSLYDRDTGALLLSGPAGGLHVERGTGRAGFQDTVGVANLTAGHTYLLEWRFSQGFGEAGYRVGWSSPSLRQEVLPTELLLPIDRATVPLMAIDPLSASAFWTDSIALHWQDHNFGESGFRVERKLASEPDNAFTVVGVTDADATSFTDTSGFSAGVTYVYRVSAVRGDQSGPSATTSVTPGTMGGFTYNGSAVVQPGPDGSLDQAEDNAVLLTSQSAGGSVGSVFSNNAVPVVSPSVPSLFGDGSVRGFTIRFDFIYPSGNADSGEGLAFVIQRNDPFATGTAGYQSGYGGIPNSFAVLFQPAYQTTYPVVNGAALPFGPQDLPFFFGYGFGTRVEIEYDADAQMITERLNQLDEFGQPTQTFTRQYASVAVLTEFGYEELSPIDIPAMIGGDFGFFGFTGAGPQLQQLVSNFYVNGDAVAFLPVAVQPPPPPQNAAPTASAGGPYDILEGDDLFLDASASTDPDGDALSYSWDVNGDGVFGDATGVGPRLTWTQLQALGLDDGDRTLAVSVQVSDGTADPVVASTTLHLGNRPADGTFTGPATVVEGAAATFAFTNVSDPSDADRNAGFTYMYFVDGNRDGRFTEDELVAGATGPSFTATFNDNGVFNVRALISDKDGGTTEHLAEVSVTNADPVAGAILAPSAAQRVNTDVTVSVPFTDAGSADTHTAVWDWGDGSTSAGTVNNHTASGTHRYAAPGLYTVSVTVTDDDGGTSFSDYRYVVVYDPTSLGVSGSGSMNTFAGRATFEFDVRYKKNATTPSGTVLFAAPGTNFRSTSLDWEVVTRRGTTYVRGHGTVNGQAGYSFLLAVIDTGTRRGAGPDKLRLTIWNDTTGVPVFETEPDARDDADPLGLIGAGNIVLG